MTYVLYGSVDASSKQDWVQVWSTWAGSNLGQDTLGHEAGN